MVSIQAQSVVNQVTKIPNKFNKVLLHWYDKTAQHTMVYRPQFPPLQNGDVNNTWVPCPYPKKLNSYSLI